MPCHSDYIDKDLFRGRETDNLKKEIDKLTALLCFACAEIDNLNEIIDNEFGSTSEFPAELSDWWNNHKEFDAKEGR